MPARPVLATGGAVALAPVLPLTLNAHNRDTGTPPSPRPVTDRSGLWLRNAAVGLCVLAAAAAAVSFTAQYRMADAARHLPRSHRVGSAAIKVTGPSEDVCHGLVSPHRDLLSGGRVDGQIRCLGRVEQALVVSHERGQ